MVRMKLTVLSKGNVLPGNLRENENRQLCVKAGGRGELQGRNAFYKINFTKLSKPFHEH